MSTLTAERRSSDFAVQQVVSDAPQLYRNYLRRQPMAEGRVIDARLADVFDSLQGGQFWHVLAAFDGYQSHPKEDAAKIAERREWAERTFNPHERDTIFNMCVTIALTSPFGIDGQPGRLIGQSILYDSVADNPDSLFYGKIDDEFRRHLQNGRLWEELPETYGRATDVHTRKVEDVLANHAEDLTLSYVKRGFEVFKRNRKHNNETGLNLHGLSNKAIDNYAAFVGQINENRDEIGLAQDDVAELVAPYAAVVVSDGYDNYGDPTYKPRFAKHSRRSYIRRLGEPLLAEYTSESPVVRDAIADELGLSERGVEIIKILPNPRGMFDAMYEHSHRYPDLSLPEFVDICVERGIQLIEVIGPKTLEAIIEAERVRSERS